ncbi:MAG TPA: LpxD N-terminal domain-containing protein, partial [Pyrinomonadaceae bacterium]
MRLSELARLTGATVEGENADIEITGAAGLDEAEAGQVAFLANPRYTPRVQTTRASAVYLAAGVEAGRTDIAVLRTRDPYLAYTRALRLFHPEPDFAPFIHPSAVIDPSARVDERVWIGACVVIGRDAEIASGVRIYPNVTIYDGVRVGEDSTLHS